MNQKKYDQIVKSYYTSNVTSLIFNFKSIGDKRNKKRKYYL